jgi:hypothetical protein
MVVAAAMKADWPEWVARVDASAASKTRVDLRTVRSCSSLTPGFRSERISKKVRLRASIVVIRAPDGR